MVYVAVQFLLNHKYFPLNLNVFFLVKTDAVKDLCFLLSQSFITIIQPFSRSRLIPSIFIDLSNTVSLCVVLAFSPKLWLTVLFNFPVLILQMLLTCPFSYLW